MGYVSVGEICLVIVLILMVFSVLKALTQRRW